MFDSSSFIVISHYFPDQFPTFWARFEKAIEAGEIISVRETLNELTTKASRPWLAQWVKDHRAMFLVPSNEELEFVREIFKIPHFQMLVTVKQRLSGNPAADPFVIAAAKVRGATVVSEESKKPNAARIPNVCEHFGIACLMVEGFLAKQGWRF